MTKFTKCALAVACLIGVPATAQVPVPADMVDSGARARVMVDMQSVQTQLNTLTEQVASAGGRRLFKTAGTYSFTVPSAVTEVFITGSGGGGSSGSSGGDCGRAGNPGGVSTKSPVSVTPGATYTVVVGAGGTSVAPFSQMYGPGYAYTRVNYGGESPEYYDPVGCWMNVGEGAYNLGLPKCTGKGGDSSFGSFVLGGGWPGTSAYGTGGNFCATSGNPANTWTYSGIAGQGVYVGKGGDVRGGTWIPGNPGVAGFMLVEW